MEEIAQVYARSLFEVARDKNRLDRVRKELGEFADAVDASHELQVYFFSPYFSSVEKTEGIQKVVSGGDEHFVRFLELLAEKHRLPAIFRIRRTFDELWAEENKLLQVEITSAVELDKKTVNTIGRRIEQETDRKVDLSAKVDPDVLGGLVIRVGNKILDASVRSRLERLRKQVAGAAA